jgi:hypothetical protein
MPQTNQFIQCNTPTTLAYLLFTAGTTCELSQSSDVGKILNEVLNRLNDLDFYIITSI